MKLIFAAIVIYIIVSIWFLIAKKPEPKQPKPETIKEAISMVKVKVNWEPFTILVEEN